MRVHALALTLCGRAFDSAERAMRVFFERWFSRLEFVVQGTLAVREHERRHAVGRKNPAIFVAHPIIHRVGRCHRRQREKQSRGSSIGNEARGQHHRCLRLAAAGHVFGDGKNRSIR